MNRFILSLFLQYFQVINSQLFSGFYTPNIKYNLEVYSASWIQKKERFLTILSELQQISSLESSTTGALLKYSFSHTEYILMTRDYFDFMIEHLSSTTNQINENESLIDYLTELTNNKIHLLKKHSLSLSNNLQSKPFLSSIVVIIPFSSKSASMGNDIYRIKKLRLLFFQATFWSIYRYFPHIIVYVSTTEDHKLLQDLSLPIDTLIQTEIDYKLAWELPKFSLLHAYNSFISNSSWNNYKYIYFTEADQILHLRSQKHIKHWLNTSYSGMTLVPHRMIVSLV